MRKEFKQKIKAFAVLFFSFFSVVIAQEKVLPAELKPFVLKGYAMLDFTEGDLNADKQKDAILILKIPGEDTVTTDDLKRPFLLLIRRPDGKLKLEKRNDSLIMCCHCGGIFGDPYEAVTIQNNSFTVSFYGGSSWRWGYDYTFTYKSAKKNWFLTKEKQISYHNTEPEINIKEAIIEDDELGIIPLEKFSSDPPYEESEWNVVVAKAYFYSNPKIGSIPRKAYLLKGDHVTGIRHLKNFIEVSFENKDQEFTTGYILKSNLEKIK